MAGGANRAPHGCAGYMILEAERPSGRERILVQVRLGVPIRQDERYVALALLAGNKVSVVYVKEKGGIVARSIEVLGKAAPATPGLDPGAGSKVYSTASAR